MLGIRTTIPFFVWLMRQPEYREGRYDTTWLDRLHGRRGEARASTSSTMTESRLVTIAAAIDAYLPRAPARPRRRDGFGAAERLAAGGAARGALGDAPMTFEIEIDGRTRR